MMNAVGSGLFGDQTVFVKMRSTIKVDQIEAFLNEIVILLLHSFKNLYIASKQKVFVKGIYFLKGNSYFLIFFKKKMR